MALLTRNQCARHFVDRVLPRLRAGFANIDYTPGDNFAFVVFDETRRYKGLRRYDRMRVSVVYATKEDQLLL